MTSTHGTTTTAGPQAGTTPPEMTAATGSKGSRTDAVAAVIRAVRPLLPEDARGVPVPELAKAPGGRRG